MEFLILFIQVSLWSSLSTYTWLYEWNIVIVLNSLCGMLKSWGHDLMLENIYTHRKILMSIRFNSSIAWCLSNEISFPLHEWKRSKEWLQCERNLKKKFNPKLKAFHVNELENVERKYFLPFFSPTSHSASHSHKLFCPFIVMKMSFNLSFFAVYCYSLLYFIRKIFFHISSLRIAWFSTGNFKALFITLNIQRKFINFTLFHGNFS